MSNTYRYRDAMRKNLIAYKRRTDINTGWLTKHLQNIIFDWHYLHDSLKLN